MSTQPTVSVVITTYNGEKYLANQLGSILSQTYPISEVIAQDDGSTDSTLNILEHMAEEFPQIKIFRNEKNLGWNLNFITAIKHATGDYIALSDQDDIWYPEKIEKQMKQIGDRDLCFSYRYKDAQYTDHGKVLGHPQPDFESLLFTSHIPGHSMLLRRRLIEEIDTWNDYIPYDWWLGIEAHLHGGVTLVPEALNWHRPHDDSASALMMKDAWSRAEHITWQPYLKGWSAYRRFQRTEDWQWLYRYISDHTTDTRFPLVHRMASLMLRPGLMPLLQLCQLTMRHRARVHERFAGGKGLKGLMNCLRGFFYPLMWTYNNNTSFIRTPQ